MDMKRRGRNIDIESNSILLDVLMSYTGETWWWRPRDRAEWVGELLTATGTAVLKRDSFSWWI